MVQGRVAPATGDATSSDFNSSDEASDATGSSAPQAVGTKRKTSYNMQKDEIATLRGEAGVLEAKLQRIHARRPAALALEHLQLQSLVRANRLLVAGAQSLMSSLQDDKPPVGTYIHLPLDPVDRQRILSALKPFEIEDAAAYMLARCQHAALWKPTRQTEVSTTAAGDHIALLWEVVHIHEGSPTVERVFDEMMAFARIREMALADRVGQIDIRESDVDMDPTDVGQWRLLSTHRTGLLVESNAVPYAQYFPHGSAQYVRPYAIFMIDGIDRDDAHPPSVQERVQQDGVSVWLMVETPPGDSPAPPSIAVIKYAFVRARKSPLATSDQLTEIAEDGLRSCSSVMLKVVRERLASDATETQ